MPRFDDLLGIATFAAAGMFVAIALAPVARGSARAAHAPSEAPGGIPGAPSPAATAIPLRTLVDVLSSALAEATRAWRAVVLRIGMSLQEQRRVNVDRDTLATMTDRELLDIGLDRASVNPAAEGSWKRDYPF